MDKDKENSFKPSPQDNSSGGTGNDPTVLTGTEKEEDSASSAAKSGPSGAPTWLEMPEIASGSNVKEDYHEEGLKPEPSKYTSISKQTQSLPRQHLPKQPKKISKQEPRAAASKGKEPRATASKGKVEKISKQEPRATVSKGKAGRTHISYRRGKAKKRRRKLLLFKLAVIILPAGILTMAYDHRYVLQDLVQPLFEMVSAKVREHTQVRDAESGITTVSDITDVAQPEEPRILASMDCHELTPLLGKLGNLAELEFNEQLAIAECYYLQGNYLQSYRLLRNNQERLHNDALMLFTILLLKRRQFKAVTSLLQDKCVSPERENSFFPCLARALLQLQQSGQTTYNTRPTATSGSNPYSSIAWLLLALRQKNYDVSSQYLTKAMIIGAKSNRRVALSYVYETLMRYVYRYGSKEQIKALYQVASRQLREEHANASWWVRFVAKLRLTDVKRREILRAISSQDNFSRMYDDLDFITIVGMESVYLGFRDTLETVINRIQQYQKRTWKNQARETLKFLEQWKIRIMVARQYNSDVLKNIKKYGKNYEKDYFYYFFYGTTLMRMMGKDDLHMPPTALLARALAKRDVWDSNYAYASALLRSGKAAPLARHMPKLKRMTNTSVHKNWLFLLRAEVKISSGKHNAAIEDLRSYIARKPSSFTAHRLLVAAYMRAKQYKEATVVRKAYDRLQKRVPYYRTEEGRTSPIGPFAML